MCDCVIVLVLVPALGGLCACGGPARTHPAATALSCSTTPQTTPSFPWPRCSTAARVPVARAAVLAGPWLAVEAAAKHSTQHTATHPPHACAAFDALAFASSTADLRAPRRVAGTAAARGASRPAMWQRRCRPTISSSPGSRTSSATPASSPWCTRCARKYARASARERRRPPSLSSNMHHRSIIGNCHHQPQKTKRIKMVCVMITVCAGRKEGGREGRREGGGGTAMSTASCCAALSA